MARRFPIGVYAIPEISMVGPPEHELTAACRTRPASRATPRSRAATSSVTGADSSRCSFTARIGVSSPCTVWGPAPGGGLDYFLETVFNYPTLAECYKVAALDASNKMRTGGAPGLARVTSRS
jgi:NAD(P) transhydrogenase